MEYTLLGNTDLKVSKIGVGTWQFGERFWGWGKEYGEGEVVTSVRRAVELGINFFDTAEIYGKGASERLLGKAIKDFRDDVVIATKVWPTRLTYGGVLKACERSLRRLGIKTIDLYQIHWPNPFMPMSRTMRAMERLVEEGKVRYIGVSNFSVKQLTRAQEELKREQIVSNQVKYNMIERKVEKELLPYLERNKITLIAYSPLAQGILSGKYSAANTPRDLVRRVNALFDKENLKRLQPLIEALRKIAAGRGKTVAQVALNWLIRRSGVVALVGVKRPSQVEENAAAADFRLGEEELRILEEVYEEISLDLLWSRLRIVKRLITG